MFSIFKRKKQSAKIPTASEINAMRESFEYEIQKNIENIIESRIPDIKKLILEAAQGLNSSTTIYLTLTEEEEKSITRLRFCHYVEKYFRNLGYIVSCSFYQALYFGTKYEYRLALKWDHA